MNSNTSESTSTIFDEYIVIISSVITFSLVIYNIFFLVKNKDKFPYSNASAKYSILSILGKQ